jgi:hypothetical protein
MHGVPSWGVPAPQDAAWRPGIWWSFGRMGSAWTPPELEGRCGSDADPGGTSVTFGEAAGQRSDAPGVDSA